MSQDLANTTKNLLKRVFTIVIIVVFIAGITTKLFISGDINKWVFFVWERLFLCQKKEF